MRLGVKPKSIEVNNDNMLSSQSVVITGSFNSIARSQLKEELIKVENNKLYIMPFWWYHRPLPQEDSKERLCFNIQYNSKDRIRLRQRNGTIW